MIRKVNQFSSFFYSLLVYSFIFAFFCTTDSLWSVSSLNYLISFSYSWIAILKTLYMNFPLKTYSDRRSLTMLYAFKWGPTILSEGSLPFFSRIRSYLKNYSWEILSSLLIFFKLETIVCISLSYKTIISRCITLSKCLDDLPSSDPFLIKYFHQFLILLLVIELQNTDKST